MNEIKKIITSPFEDDYTLIKTVGKISKWKGTRIIIEYSGGEFGLMLCEEFKKYWESKGYKVRIEKKKISIFGERVICTKVGNIKEKIK